MKKIKWKDLFLVSGGIVIGFLFKDFLLRNNLTDYLLVPFTILICLAFICIDLKPEK